MDSTLIDQLVGSDPQLREDAADGLVNAGGQAVEPVLELLRGSNSPGGGIATGMEHLCIQVLQRIGEPAFRPLVHAIETADTWGAVVDFGSALEGLEVPDKAAYVPLLQHENPRVRNRVLCAFETLGPEALPYAPAVLPLIGDPDDDVRGRAEQALKKMGPDVIQLLRRMRRSPGHHRRQALTALAEIGGWDALDEIDKSLVQRLVSTKIAHEVPEPMYLCGSWYAVRTADQAGVLDAFGLSDAMPVTMRLGEAAWHNDHHNVEAKSGSSVYVTPVLDGWTLVFGDPSEDAPTDNQESNSRTSFAAALSRRFGAAHWYLMFEGWTAWCIAEAAR